MAGQGEGRAQGRTAGQDGAGRSTEEFRGLLKRHREARRWSQERLAAEAEMDHSLVSRLESGQRAPTREAIDKLGRGLQLRPEEKDRLLIAAGYFPEHAENAVVDEPAVRRLYLLLRDEDTPEPVRENLRNVLSGLADIALAS